MAAYEDFTIDQGTDIAFQIELTEADGSVKDLSAYTVSAKMKRNFNSKDEDTIEFSAMVADPSSDGILVLSLTNEQTDALSTRGRYVYDVEITYIDANGYPVVERILEGKIKVSPSVTR
jgi:hypothetical protein